MGKKAKDPHRRWKVFAQKLHNSISTVHQVRYDSRLRNWANEIRKLHTKEKVSPRRIREVLSWYCRAYQKQNDPYLPVAQSGGAFRNKFLRIERAMKRNGGGNGEDMLDKWDPGR